MLLHVHMYRVVTTKYTFVPKNFIPINCLFLADSRKLFRTQYNNTTVDFQYNIVLNSLCQGVTTHVKT